MNIMKITKYDTANGPGIRTTVWVSGCSHQCKGCHNPNTWNPSNGMLFTDNYLTEILNSINPDYINGITISGGDPLYYYNLVDVAKIVRFTRLCHPNKSIWLYTGYKYEDLLSILESDDELNVYLEIILNSIDVLVDGEYDESLRDISLPYCGSSNQRVIDMNKTRVSNNIILYEKG